MPDYRSSQDVSVKDEVTQDQWQIDSDRDGHIKSKLWDGTNEVTVTTNGAREELDVNANVTSVPDDDDYIYKHPFLLNGSNKSMDVDGSSTPVPFRFTPGAGEVWFVESLSLFIYDPGSMDLGDFGAIEGALTNGLQINIKSKGTVYEFVNLQDNTDISLSFIGRSGSAGDESFGWLDSVDNFFGVCPFQKPMRLDGDQGDYIEYNVRDNLTALTDLQGSVLVRRVI